MNKLEKLNIVEKGGPVVKGGCIDLLVSRWLAFD